MVDQAYTTNRVDIVYIHRVLLSPHTSLRSYFQKLVLAELFNYKSRVAWNIYGRAKLARQSRSCFRAICLVQQPVHTTRSPPFPYTQQYIYEYVTPHTRVPMIGDKCFAARRVLFTSQDYYRTDRSIERAFLQSPFSRTPKPRHFTRYSKTYVHAYNPNNDKTTNNFVWKSENLY